MYVSGAETRRRQQPDYYKKLVSGPHEQQLTELIKIGMLIVLYYYIISDARLTAQIANFNWTFMTVV